MELKIRRTRLLTAQINYHMQTGNVAQAYVLQQEKDFLLTNGGQPPIPRKLLNQRQRRKRQRQNHN